MDAMHKKIINKKILTLAIAASLVGCDSDDDADKPSSDIFREQSQGQMVADPIEELKEVAVSESDNIGGTWMMIAKAQGNTVERLAFAKSDVESGENLLEEEKLSSKAEQYSIVFIDASSDVIRICDLDDAETQKNVDGSYTVSMNEESTDQKTMISYDFVFNSNNKEATGSYSLEEKETYFNGADNAYEYDSENFTADLSLVKISDNQPDNGNLGEVDGITVPPNTVCLSVTAYNYNSLYTQAPTSSEGGIDNTGTGKGYYFFQKNTDGDTFEFDYDVLNSNVDPQTEGLQNFSFSQKSIDIETSSEDWEAEAVTFDGLTDDIVDDLDIELDTENTATDGATINSAVVNQQGSRFSVDIDLESDDDSFDADFIIEL